MDPNTARHVLRIDPLNPAGPAVVEAAYAREAWQRHPSRYPDAEGRRAAEAWALTLAAARATLLGGAAEVPANLVPSPPPPAPETVPVASIPGSDAWPPPTAPRATDASLGAPAYAIPLPAVAPTPRRLSAGAVLGIMGGALALILVISGVAVGATALAQRLAEIEPVDVGGPVDTETYSADETYFTFPTAMELYHDGRYLEQCPAEFTFGCWEAAIITEASCASVQVDLEFSNDREDSTVQARETITVSDVVAGEITPIVFGHDGYDYGWISDVRCVDDVVTAEPATNANAVSTPLARLEAGRWAFEDTGFWFPASLEVYDDGRLGPCPPEVERGCWQAAILPEASCERLTVQYSYSNGMTSQLKHGTTRADVVPGEPVEVVFGNDGYEFGWISLVSCTS